MSEANRIDTLLGNATTRLADVSDSARLDAELLLCRCIDMPRSYLFAHPEDTLDEAACERLNLLLERRLSGEPMAYITGIREFWSMELIVSPATLVPRPETELLVDLALRQIPRETKCQVLDLGTGSGAVAVAIAKERPLCQITAVDLSAAALDVAKENVRQQNLGNVTCIEGDWVQPVAGQQFDIVVSNPPYVSEAEYAELDKNVRDYEPREALIAGPKGLDIYERLLNQIEPFLKPDAALMLEIGYQQGPDIATMLEASGLFSTIQIHKDSQTHDRLAIGLRGKTV